MNSYKIVEQINSEVNCSIVYKTDLEQYDKPEHWVLPNGKYGDCEDYCLLKFHKLIEVGFDRTKIFLIFCIMEGAGGRAVLFVKTDVGGFILDNNYPTPQNPLELPYKWVSILRNKSWYELHSFA
jgi:predicted transglutaminase-like cysteine proteinase